MDQVRYMSAKVVNQGSQDKTATETTRVDIPTEEKPAKNKRSSPDKGNSGFVFVFGFVLVSMVIIIYQSNCQQVKSDLRPVPGSNEKSGIRTPSSVPAPPEGNKLSILQEQKAKSENLTRRSIELIKAGRISEAQQLYRNRWDELATVRAEVMADRSLTDDEKQNIDMVLLGEQQAVDEVLATYDQLYEP